MKERTSMCSSTVAHAKAISFHTHVCIYSLPQSCQQSSVVKCGNTSQRLTLRAVRDAQAGTVGGGAGALQLNLTSTEVGVTAL